MQYTQDMNLVSGSGYCMPFEEKNGNVNIVRPYGQQDGSDEFNHGIDFATKAYPLASVADGIVSGIGVDREKYGLFIVVKHGKYEVTYGCLSNVYAQFGQKVKAATLVAVSSDIMHLEVRYAGEEMNPLDFITMLFGNVKVWSQKDAPQPEYAYNDVRLFTDYENEKEEIEQLMLRYYSLYMTDLGNGIYSVPQRTGESLRNLFTVGAVKDYFYECIPSMLNPLGIGNKAIPIVTKAQNLLIGDFLNYLALRHRIFLSAMDNEIKKKEPILKGVDASLLMD